MARDIVYYYDKNTFTRQELGEIEQDFNMSFVLDGTKDSFSIEVFSYADITITPFTIISHSATNTWWCVQHDKVERYLNEDGSFLYKHILQLTGAIDVLNARDLTDCGFTQNKYTFEQVIKRLFTLSNFEFLENDNDMELVLDIPTGLGNSNVDYLKTYENYTLLSALRDFLNGYNMDAKIRFTYTTYPSVHKQAIVELIYKNGDSTIGQYEMSAFDYVKENRTIDSNSYGGKVISNMNNVVGTKAKTYPTVGGVRLSDDKYEMDIETAFLRLPSPAYKVNWLKISSQLVFHLEIPTWDTVSTEDFSIVLNAGTSAKNIYDKIEQAINWLNDNASQYPSGTNIDGVINFLNVYRDYITTHALLAKDIIIEEGGHINGETGYMTHDAGLRVPTFYHGANPLTIYLTDKETSSMDIEERQAIAWEKGSDKITNFKFLKDYNKINYHETGYDLPTPIIIQYDFVIGGTTVTLVAYITNEANIDWRKTNFVINYIPMSDMKIIRDNRVTRRDTQLYNQNGKMSGGMALTKLINSYADEISGDNITRYMGYYNFDSVPKVGSIVTKGNDKYVINNVSLDFYHNENTLELTNRVTYFIEAEISMSKAVAVKSLMVNANSNIRDYGIPQQYNVKRIQVEKDIYTLSYTHDTYAWDNMYALMTLENLFNAITIDHTSVMKITYKQAISGDTWWAYQLPVISHILAKSYMEIVDFKDNNIIGYGNATMWGGLVISNLFSRTTYNVPVSYVDNDGEFEDITIRFVNSYKYQKAWEDYLDEQGVTTDVDPANYNPIIPSTVYGKVENGIAEDEGLDYSFIYAGYKKDATEVPVFEYIGELVDTPDVEIGDNFMNANVEDDKHFCLYHYIVQNLGTLNVNNVLYYDVANNIHSESASVVYIDNAVNLVFVNDNSGYQLKIDFKYYEEGKFDNSTLQKRYETAVNMTANKDIGVIRYVCTYDPDNNILRIDKKEVVCVIHKNPAGNTTPLYINLYKK